MSDATAARVFFVLGAAAAFIGVAVGAFAAHALRGRVATEALATFETGVRYHMYHALALLGVAWATTRWGPQASVAGWCFVAGIVLFSGSLYALAITGQRTLGAITPLGGVCFLAGWVVLAWAAWSAR